MPRSRPPAERFRQKFTVAPSGCWEWTGSIQKGGSYGVLWIEGQNVGAHRFSYEMVRGKIPPGLQIDHLCRNRRCVNPEHLEAVTPRENVIRGETFARDNLLKIECPAGHPYEGNNLELGKDGRRICGECRRRRWREYWHRKRKFDREAKARHVIHQQTYLAKKRG